MSYIGNSPGVASQRVTTTLTATAGQTQFTTQSGYVLGYVDVYLNGAKLVNGADFEAISGTFVTLFTGAALNDVVELISYVPRGLTDGYTKAEADAKFLDVGGDTASGSLALAAASLTGNLTLSGGTAGGVAYLNGSKVVTTGTGLTFDGSTLSVLTANALPLNLSSSNASVTLVQHTNSNASADLFYRFRQNGGGGNFYDLTMEGATNAFTIDYNDNERLRITSAGNVGIGTSSPAAKLDVVGSAQIGANAAKTKFYSDSAYNGIFNGASLVSNESIYMGGGMQFFYASGSEQMRLTSTGLGIGTTAPGAQLQLNRSGTSDYTTFRLSNSGASGKTYEIGVGGNTSAAGYANNLYFYDSTAGALRMILDASGNVGIGTGSPNIYSNSFARQLTLQSTSGYANITVAGGDGGGIDFGTNTIRQAGLYSLSGSVLAFYTNSSNSGTSLTERARITSGGDVLLGTTTNTGAISGSNLIMGNGSANQITFQIGGSVSGFVYNNSGETAIGAPTSGMLKFQRAGVGTMAQFDSSGRMQLGTTTMSDANGSRLTIAATFPMTPLEIRSDSTSGHYAAVFYNPFGLIGQIQTNGNDFVIGGAGANQNLLLTTGNGTPRARIDSIGRFLIGSSTAAGGSASGTLQVGNTFSGITNTGSALAPTIITSGSLEFNFDGVAGTQRHGRIVGTAGNGVGGAYGGGLNFEYYAYDGVSTYQWYNGMSIDAGGNVGIGTSTPGAKLQVVGRISITGGRGPSFALQYADWSLHNTTSGNNFAFSNYSTELVTITQAGSLLIGGTSARASAKLDVVGDVMVLGSNPLYYATIDYSAGSGLLSLAAESGGGIRFLSGTTERARITTTGRMAIGYSGLWNDSAPYLQVRDGVLIGSVNSAALFTTIKSPNGYDIELTANANPANLGVHANIIFRSGNSGGGGPSELARFVSTGAFLINTTFTNFSERFKIDGGVGGYAVHTIKNDSGAQGHFVFSNPNGAVGTIFTNGSTTAYNTSSDYRLKNITGPVTNSGAYIDSLEPVEGTWKADGSVFVGLLAHRAQAVSRTNVATGEKDGTEMQSMDYSSPEFIANIIAELQSLRARVAQLENT
jgi:hypothetical protein